MPFIKFDGGFVNAKDPRELSPGDLTSAIGVRYTKQGIATTGARDRIGAMTNQPLTALAFAQYDSADDILLALSGFWIFEGEATLTGFSAIQVAIFGGSTLVFDAPPTDLSIASFEERLYIATGQPVSVASRGLQNIVREADGYYRTMGMLKPGNVLPGDYTPFATGYTVATAANVPVDAGSVGDFELPDEVRTDDQFNAAVVSNAPGIKTQVWAFSGTSGDGTDGRSIIIKVAGEVGAQGALDARILVNVSTNGVDPPITPGVALNATIPFETQTVVFPIASTVLIANVRVRVSTRYISGAVPAIDKVFYIAKTAGIAVAATITTGVRYVVSERDSARDLPGDFSPESNLVVGTFNSIGLPLPLTMQNGSADTIDVWRSSDGALEGEYDRYSRIAALPSTLIGTTFIDTFSQPVTEIGIDILPVEQLGSDADPTFYPRDPAPPLYRQVWLHGSILCGLPVGNPGKVYYSVPNRHESRLALYELPIKSPRNDDAVAGTYIDNVSLVWMKSWTKRIRSFNLIVDNAFTPTEAENASTTRGLCGMAAFVHFSGIGADGKSWIFCVDGSGMYITDGYQFVPWSENLVWADAEDSRSLASSAYLDRTTVEFDPVTVRFTVRYVSVGSTTVDQQLDFYCKEMRQDGQPRIEGPHAVNNRAMSNGRINDRLVRWTGGVDGGVYVEGVGTTDDSLATDADGTVPRVITGADMPLGGGLGELFHVKKAMLRSTRGAFEPIALALRLKLDSAEVQLSEGTVDPNANSPVGVGATGETGSVTLTDSGTSAKAVILGVVLDANQVGGAGSAVHAAVGAVAGESSVPGSGL